MSLFEIKCPMCKGTIFIDPASGQVIDHKAADHAKADFNQFVKDRQEQSGKWDDKIKKVRDEQSKRRAMIEEQFKKAREEGVGEVEAPLDNPFKWD